MDSIAVIKPHMAVLSQERLLLSPFGALTQAFVAEILARAEQEEGEYSRVPLELLEEGEPVFFATGVTTMTDGVPLEYYKQLFRADRFKFVSMIKRRMT